MTIDPSHILAWYQYPEPDGTSYTSKDLESLDVVECLFDYCQILLGVINKEGWQVLVEIHGIDRLLAVNKISGWFCEDTAFNDLRYHCLITGYDPITGLIGKYHNCIFSPDRGGEYTILWGG